MGKNSLFNGIFGHFFARTSIVLVLAGLLLLGLVLPFFDHLADNMAEEQGNTLASSTLAATYNALYKNDYSVVVDYCMEVMNDTPNILFIIYSKRSGDEIVISPKQWSLQKKTFPYYKQRFTEDKRFTFNSHSIAAETIAPDDAKQGSFEFNKAIMISGQDWGVLTIGFSKGAYFSIVHNFYWAFIGFTISVSLVALLLFYLVSHNIRRQIQSFEATAELLASGELTARAPENAIGEIGVLGKAINNMSQALQEKSARLFQLARIVEETNDAFILFDRQLNIVFMNESIEALTGYSLSFFKHHSLHQLANTLRLNLSELIEELGWMEQHKKNSPPHDITLTKRDGTNIYAEMRLEYLADETQNQYHYLMVLANITERKQFETELHQLAFYDKLTGLPNRRMFMDHLQKSIHQAARRHKSFALFFMDLDNFKHINDSLGHEAGDLFLVEVAQRLLDIFRASDTVSRLGGDEFTVIVEHFNDPSFIDIANLAEKLVTQLSSKTFQLYGRVLTISTSVGIALYPNNGLDYDTLVKNADTAMYSAKKSGKNRFAFFSEEMNHFVNQHLSIEEELRTALDSQDQLMLYYQPIFDLSTEKLVGAEALARWRHPTKGMVAPNDFIPIAEKSDLIVQVSDHLLSIAFAQLKTWITTSRSSDSQPLYLSVNISVRQFEKSNFVDKIQALLNFHEVPSEYIQLEFTEGIMMDMTPETFNKFNALKKIGFRIAIDDFGTGYSSLGYIHQLPIDVIKIDRAFVSGMLDNKKTRAIVTAISRLSTTLELKTIAEGIELTQHADLLKKATCGFGQGYLYDQPLPIEEFEKKYLS